LSAGSTQAGQGQSLPAFELTAEDGSVVSSGSIATGTAALIVFVRPGCAPCDGVLHGIEAVDQPSAIARVVIVVSGADAAAVRAEVARHPKLAQATWYGDPPEDGLRLLRLTGAPSVAGLRAHTVDWTLSGVLSDSIDLRSILSTWLLR
jgi:hypothetical protein